MRLSTLSTFTALLSAIDATSASPATPQLQTASPAPIDLENRARVDGPANAMPTEQTQQSPVMTVYVNGKQAVYTQKFSDVPDQWPTPEVGTIGLGTLAGEVKETGRPTGTKTVGKRDGAPAVETGSGTGWVGRCRTWGV